MILQITEGLTTLANLGGLFIILLGVVWFIYCFHEATRRKSFLKKNVEEWDFDITKLLAVLSIFGFVLGALALLSGAAGLILDKSPSAAYTLTIGIEQRNVFAGVFLIVLGIFTFIKPLNDIPIAGAIGLIVSTLICIILVFLIPDTAITLIAQYINPKILLAIIFIIILSIVAIIVKFYTEGLMFLSKVISWPPIAFILAIFCFIYGIGLLAGVSLIG